MATTLSVNGEDGSTLARSTGIRLVQDGSQALVLRDQERITRDGQPGRNAPQAIAGGNAGTLAVRLSESRISQGAIRVDRVEYRSVHHPPQVTEVPVGRNIILTAIGGEGESGHDGGDGQRGFDGVGGAGASKASDATHGTDGGRGGDAGRGSSGGDGGPGGMVHIIVNAHNTHLLMAVSCDVTGGQGGRAGKHGKAGAGGSGGKGGEDWRWDEIVGYKPYCTDSCIKNHAHAANSGAMTRAGTRFNASSSALMARTGALTVSGGNLQNMIAQAAVRYNAMRQPRTDDGYCKCGGGTGSCQGCDVKPVIKTFKRQPGLDGKDGAKGNSLTTPLAVGRHGEEGRVSIAVQHNDGSTQVYPSVWSLELVDFEVEDENGDGIFEPGEHIFIRRIKVRNVGGMPSPTCRIPVALANNSTWFEPMPFAQGGLTYLPTSIPAGESASTEGSIKIRIKDRSRANSRPGSLATRFAAKGSLTIRADMPWLDRRMPSFNFEKEIEIGYPCHLEEFQHLSTVAQGAISKIQFKVMNTSNRPLGEQTTTGRARIVEVRASMLGEFGRLGIEDDEVDSLQSIPYIRPQDSVSTEQQFRILLNARSHTHFSILFELYLESPLQDPSSQEFEMTLIERRSAQLQVSNRYTQAPNAKFLLVTNPRTTEQQSHAIQHFIRSSLGMEVDLCNVHQNGGLLRISENGLEEALPITSAYRDKTIFVLDNAFDFFGAGETTSSGLFDPRWLTDISGNSTSILFVGSEDSDAFEKIARSAVLLPPLRLDSIMSQIKRSHFFTSKDELVDSIIQDKQFGSASLEVSAIPLERPKWYHRFKRYSAEKQAKRLERYLRDSLPNERFLVTYVSPRQKVPHGLKLLGSTEANVHSSLGHLVILTGLDHHCSIQSTDSSVTLAPPNSTDPNRGRLDEYGKYNIISALPFRQRISFLWRNRYPDGFISKAMILSVIGDLAKRIDGLVEPKDGPPACADESDIKAVESYLQTHLPHLHQIFNEPRARQMDPPPEPILEILHWMLAFTATGKHYKRLRRTILAMMQSRPSTRDFETLHAETRTRDPATCNPDSLVQEIAQLTRTPDYRFTNGQLSASDIVPHTRYCTPGEWNALVRSGEEWMARLHEDMERAQRELGSMLVDFSPTGAAELAAGAA